MSDSNETHPEAVESHKKEWNDFRRMLRANEREAFDEVLQKMGSNWRAADYLGPEDPQVGMELSLYVEAELERQELRDRVDELEEQLDHVKSYLAARAVEQQYEDKFQ